MILKHMTFNKKTLNGVYSSIMIEKYIETTTYE